MEKPYRQEYEDLLKKQGEERGELVNKAHDEALKDEQKISGFTSEIERIKKGGEAEKSVERQEFKEAKEILGEDFLGPEAVKGAFGIEFKEIPEIPFSKEDLERAKELNQQLVFYADKAPDGQFLTGEKLFELTGNKTSDSKKLFYDTNWYKNEDFFTKEKPKDGWKLVAKEVISGSADKNYLQQTETIVDYLKNDVFKNKPLPEEYQKAIDGFESKKQEIKKLLGSDWEKAAEELEKLEITKLTRETPVEAFYRLILNEKENKNRLLPDKYTWTSRRSSDGRLVSVGDFASSGVLVNGHRPDDSRGFLGVSFSRSF